uniref:Secreted protein n=1 Tax=Achlya hypogyna TaxID=1202772 RepID=A0A0A7CMP9_ACHHY|nr:secreted protein [Achlya hypogyna]
MRAIFAAVVASCALAAPADLGLGPPVLPSVLSTLLTAYKPLLANFTKAQLPASIGNCDAASPPLPCMDSGGNLYEDKSSDWYKVTARWISGINTMNLASLDMAYDATGALALTAVVTFDNLPLSLRVDGCLFNACTMVMDNTKYCCGSDKTVTLSVAAACAESYPFIRNATVTDAVVSPALNVQVKVAGQVVKLKDITPAVQNGIKTTAGTFFESKGMELLNKEIQSLFGDKVYCSQAAKDRDTPVPTTAPPPTTAPATTTPAPEMTQ